jgi:hypothetical protein
VTAAARQLYDFLLADLEATESTTYATALLTAAKAQITAGGGQLGFINSASLNGKNFGKQLVLTALDTALAARKALDDYDDDGQVQITNPDFGGAFFQS